MSTAPRSKIALVCCSFRKLNVVGDATILRLDD